MASGQLFCGHCGAPNAVGTRFCSQCGTALGSAAGAGVSTGVPAGVPAGVLAGVPAGVPPPPPAYAPAARYVYQQPAPAHRARLPFVLAGAGLLVLMVIFAIVGAALTPKAPESCLSAQCRVKPPTGSPLGPQHVYNSSANGWRLEWYDIHAAPFSTKTDANGIEFSLDAGGGLTFPVVLTSEKARGRSPQQIVNGIVQARFSGAQPLYTVPGMLVGIDPGYANVYQVGIRVPNGQTVDGRLIVGAAIKGDTAIEMVSIGPFRPPSKKDGHPNPSQTLISFVDDSLLKGVYFPGDRSR